MSCINFHLLLALLGCSHALKIAVGDNYLIGTGSGSGSGSGSEETEKEEDIDSTPLAPIVLQVAGTSGTDTITFSVATLNEILKEIPAGFTSPKVSATTTLPVAVDPSSCDAVEVQVTAVSQAGVKTVVTIANLADAVKVELAGCSGATSCVTWDTTTSAWVTTASSGTPPNCFYTSLSTKSGLGSTGGVSGDPKATNLAGQNFDILAMGTFQLLSISEASSLTVQNRLALDATIDRAGEMCGATYIKNVSMTGSWIQEIDGLQDVRIRAAADLPKSQALQISLGDEEWTASKKVREVSIIKKASEKRLEFLIHGVTVEAQIDSHRIRKNGAKTNKFANFLNVNVKGLKEKQQEGVHLGGLLAYDDHAFAVKAPDACKPGKLANLKQKLDVLDTDEQMSFLSNIDVN